MKKRVAGLGTHREGCLFRQWVFTMEVMLEQRLTQSEGPALWLPRGRVLKAKATADAKALWKQSAGCVRGAARRPV